MKTRFISMVAAAAVVAASGAVLLGGAAQSASAATSSSCTSNLVKTVSLTASTGNKLGEGRLYSNGNGGWCAMTVHTGSFAGKATYTSVGITGMKLNGTGVAVGTKGDSGNYTSYAGPILVASPCVYIEFEMTNANRTHGNTSYLEFGCNAYNGVTSYPY